MKVIQHYYFKRIAFLLFLVSTSFYAQETPTFYVEVITMHWNMELEDFSMDEWKDTEIEFHEKVTMKNEHILSTTVLQHHFTEDSSEILFITVYPSWTAMETAIKRNDELAAQAWPDEKEREAFFKKQSKFYDTPHSDEIYVTIPGAKALEELELPLIYYVRTSYFTFPEDGNGKEFMDVLNEYNEVVTHKNEHYKAYYPQTHYYGADRTEFVEVFVAETLAELEKGIAQQGRLFAAHWDTEEKKDVYDKVMDKYLTGIHSDRIYSSVPELHKSMNPPEED
jgi:hypothetical protein